MRQSQRWRLVALVLSVGLVTLAWLLRPVLVRQRWAPEQVYTYRFGHAVAGQTTALLLAESMGSDRAAQTTAHVVALDYAGTLEVVPQAALGGYQRLLLLLRTEANQQRQEPVGSMQQASCLVMLSDRGVVKGMTFTQQDPPSLRAELRTIVSAFQTDFPAHRSRRWHSVAEDLNGRFPVRFGLGWWPWGGVRIRRTATLPTGDRVSRLLRGTDSGLRTLREGHVSLRFAGYQGHLSSLDLDQSSRTEQAGRQIGQDRQTLSLALQEMGPLGPEQVRRANLALASLDRDSFADGLAGDAEQILARQARWAEQAGGEPPLAAVLQELADAPFANETSDLPVYLRLKAMLEHRPGTAAAVGRSLADAPRMSRAFDSLATALTTVGSPEAQTALREALDAWRGDDRCMEALVPHLGLVREPTRESEAYLRQLAASSAAEGIVAAAQLSLGVMGYHLRDLDAPRSHAIYRDAVASLAEAGGPRAIDLGLSVLGNIGHPDTIQVVRPYLESAEEAIRARAADTLRAVRTEEASQLLLQIGSSDSSPLVRVRAVEALPVDAETGPLATRLDAMLNAEPAPEVVKEISRKLASLAETEPRARQALAHFLSECAHPDLCPFVQGLLLATGENR